MELQFTNETDTAQRTAHRLPCTIHHDGEAPTARAFCPFPEPIPSFRGRKLQSAEFSISDSSSLIFVESKPASTAAGPEQNKHVFKVKFAVQPNGYFYEHDTLPNPNSAAFRALDWLSISEALHNPLESVESENREDAQEALETHPSAATSSSEDKSVEK